jgi:lantibiotic modifying enzyme
MSSDPLLRDPVALAREIGDAICADAEPVEEGCRWLSRHDAEYQGHHTGVYMGGAGIALFLLHLYERTREAAYREVALRAIRWLETRAAAADEGMAGPGLYEGRGALASLCCRAAVILEDRSLLSRAEAHAEACAAMEAEATELLFGTAGVGLLLLELHRATGKERYLRSAEAAGDALLPIAEPVGAGCRWPYSAKMPRERPDRCWTGMAHGAAGIGVFYLDLLHATGAPRFAECARATGRRLIEVAERDGPHWVWDRFDPASDAERLAQWCHGAPGNGLFFLRAHALLGDDAFREATEACIAATLAAGDIRQNPSQCHGLCGNAELFLEAYRTRDDLSCLEMAQQFAAMALRYRRRVNGRAEWQSHTPGITTPDYLIGSAGVGQFFLRLDDPKATAMPFMGAEV